MQLRKGGKDMGSVTSAYDIGYQYDKLLHQFINGVYKKKKLPVVNNMTNKVNQKYMFAYRDNEKKLANCIKKFSICIGLFQEALDNSKTYDQYVKGCIGQIFQVISSLASQRQLCYAIYGALKIYEVKQKDILAALKYSDSNIHTRVARLEETLVPEYFRLAGFGPYLEYLEAKDIDLTHELRSWMTDMEESFNINYKLSETDIRDRYNAARKEYIKYVKQVASDNGVVLGDPIKNVHEYYRVREEMAKNATCNNLTTVDKEVMVEEFIHGSFMNAYKSLKDRIAMDVRAGSWRTRSRTDIIMRMYDIKDKYHTENPYGWFLLCVKIPKGRRPSKSIFTIDTNGQKHTTGWSFCADDIHETEELARKAEAIFKESNPGYATYIERIELDNTDIHEKFKEKFGYTELLMDPDYKDRITISEQKAVIIKELLSECDDIKPENLSAMIEGKILDMLYTPSSMISEKECEEYHKIYNMSEFVYTTKATLLSRIYQLHAPRSVYVGAYILLAVSNLCVLNNTKIKMHVREVRYVQISKLEKGIYKCAVNVPDRGWCTAKHRIDAFTSVFSVATLFTSKEECEQFMKNNTDKYVMHPDVEYGTGSYSGCIVLPAQCILKIDTDRIYRT